MNRTKIEWTDYTWNPVTGCWGPGGTAEKPNRCFYCYAQKVARRFTKDQKLGYSDPFMPKLWGDRLNQPAKIKKPSKIFVCSMGELFGEWVPDEWINQVIGTAWFVAPHHTFQFLTKNPKRLLDFNPWPSNCWVGTTVTNQTDADERLPWLLQVEAPVRFVSHEPLLEDIVVDHYLFEDEFGNRGQHFVGDFKIPFDDINWAIIGAMTGPRAVKAKAKWVQDLINQYRGAGVPVFLKDNLHWPEKIQEEPG